jgi:ABC-type methionine transport system permease subunit
MIQFITNHPYWTGIIIYLVIGFILGLHYYFYETYRRLEKRYMYETKNEILSENLGTSISFIFLWFVYLIADILDLYIGISRRY